MRGAVIADGRRVVDIESATAAGLTVVTLGVVHPPAPDAALPVAVPIAAAASVV
jgi:hypothetical protein